MVKKGYIIAFPLTSEEREFIRSKAKSESKDIYALVLECAKKGGLLEGFVPAPQVPQPEAKVKESE